MTINDQDIIFELKEGKDKNKAFRMLVQKYQQRLYWHIRKIVVNHDDTDDILQETMIKVWRNIDNFREESSLFTWLYRISTNEALSFLKQKQRQATNSDDGISDYLVETLRADPHFNGDDIQRKLQEAILKLPEKQRLVFNMKYFDEITYQDMSNILGTTEGALKAS
ncbi:MAG: RNA polymerase sigma factor, partial [Bacteroidota bacterium]|nr:RNA polymerase sigma factor [Bacteroidota bacterium]